MEKGGEIRNKILWVENYIRSKLKIKVHIKKYPTKIVE